MAQSLFTLIKQRQPHTLIDVLAPAWSAPLLARMPEVNQALTMPLGHGQFHLKQRYRIAKQLPRSYQQAIVLPNSFKSALIPWFARIPQRTGWRGEMRVGLLNDMRLLDKTRLPQMVQRFAALALARDEILSDVPKPSLQVDEVSRQHTLVKHGLPTQPAILALCPGAEFGSAKCWPASHYAALARTKLDQGWQVWIIGSPKDHTIAAEIQHATQQRCRNLAGQTTLAEAIDLLSLATIVVANDSGLMHIAAALARKVIACYGSTDPQFAPPLTPHARVLWQGLACSPCRQRVCPLGHRACLYDITVPQVLAAMDDLEFATGTEHACASH